MPKMKTRSAVTKRFTETGSGKVKCMHDCKNHNLTKKSRNRKRRLRKTGYVSKQYQKNIKGMI